MNSDYVDCDAMNPELQALLESASRDQLANLIRSLYSLNPVVDDRIESRLLTTGDPAALIEQLEQRIHWLQQDDRYIPYDQNSVFSLSLSAITGDIELLLDADPQAALKLTDLFMSTHPSVCNRADDSLDGIGSSYRDGAELWLAAAQRCRRLGLEQGIDWLDALAIRHADDNYWVWAELVAKSAILLTKAELLQLRKRFEDHFQQGLQSQTGDHWNHAMYSAHSGLAAVSQALGDSDPA